MMQVLERNTDACDTFLSIVSNWQDYTDEERIVYINSLDADTLVALGTMGAAGMVNILSYMTILLAGVSEHTVSMLCSLCAWRALQKMEPLSMNTIDILDEINDKIALYGYMHQRRN